jgi:translation elongation factor EF-Ts
MRAGEGVATMPAACSVVRVRMAGAETVRAAAVMAGAVTAVAALTGCPAAEYLARMAAQVAARVSLRRPRRHQANRAGAQTAMVHGAGMVKVVVAAASTAPANRAATRTSDA